LENEEIEDENAQQQKGAPGGKGAKAPPQVKGGKPDSKKVVKADPKKLGKDKGVVEEEVIEKEPTHNEIKVQEALNAEKASTRYRILNIQEFAIQNVLKMRDIGTDLYEK